VGPGPGPARARRCHASVRTVVSGPAAATAAASSGRVPRCIATQVGARPGQAVRGRPPVWGGPARQRGASGAYPPPPPAGPPA
jgi:hypothetical protein